MKKLIATLFVTFSLMLVVAPAGASVGAFFSNFPKTAVAVARIGTDSLEVGTSKVAYVAVKVAAGAAKLDELSDEYVEGQPTYQANLRKAAAKKDAKAAARAAKQVNKK